MLVSKTPSAGVRMTAVLQYFAVFLLLIEISSAADLELELDQVCPAQTHLSELCCEHTRQGAVPSSGEKHPLDMRDIQFSFFLVASNDLYGGYRTAVRSSNAVYALVHGIYMFGLQHSVEIIVVDWQAEKGSGGGGTNGAPPLRCTPEFQRVLSRTPLVCTGGFNERSCFPGMVRIIEVPTAVTARYAPDSVSEVHAFNVAVRRMRGKNLLRIDQDTLTRGPFFSWMAWQQRSGWPDVRHVIWKERDSDIKRDQVPLIVDDIRFWANYLEHICQQHHGNVPLRPKYDPEKAHGAGAKWEGCWNGAVGVYGYPKVLMEDVRGMNERMIYWGGMEAELCRRASKSSKFVNWVDIGPELCGASFAHMQHEYGRKQQGAQGSTEYNNGENWGLFNETLPEFVY